jgi:trimethylamine--corrinoid protein Co-methyltransferase
MSFSVRCVHPYEICSHEFIAQIHSQSLDVLQHVGVVFDDIDALKFLEAHGCDVDADTRVVRFEPELVEGSMRKLPVEFKLHARNPDYDIVFGGDRVHFSACSGMQVLDLESMQRRPGTLEDAKQAVKLCDALTNMAGSNTGLGDVVDKPTETNLEWLYATAIRNSEKVTSVGVMNDSEKWGIRMAQTAGEDIIVTVNSASPLGWTADQILGAMRAIEAGLPIGLQSMASPGVTAPATLAGTATMMNAEILAMATYVQLQKPGTGLMYSCFTIPLDMRTTMLASGSIELGMLTALSAQLSRFYNMGSIVYLPMTDAKLPDQQTGYEKAMQWLLAGMSGINLIWGAGMVDGHSLWSNAQLVIDAEMCGMVARCLEGINGDQQNGILDLIRQVGHFPGSYLSSEHTLENWQSERYMPIASLRTSFEEWLEGGRESLLERAQEKAQAILDDHQVVQLAEEVDREIDDLLAAAAREKGIA